MRKWILKILGVQKQLDNLKEANQVQNQVNKKLVDTIENLMSGTFKLKGDLEALQKLIHIGVDVNYPNYGPTWCIVMVKGKDNTGCLVNYFQIKFEHVIELKKILKDFEDRNYNVTYDLPRGGMFGGIFREY